MEPLVSFSWQPTQRHGKKCKIALFCLFIPSIRRALKKILTLPNSEIPLPEDRHKSKDYGIPVTTLREIKYLKRVRHPNCVELLDIAFEKGKYLMYLERDHLATSSIVVYLILQPINC